MMLKGAPPAVLPYVTVASVRQLREFPRSSFEIVFTTGWWDGPLSGMLKANDRYYWFNVVEPHDRDDNANPSGDGYGEPRVLAIFEITEEQRREEEKWRELFERHVHPRGGSLRPKEEWEFFYGPASQRNPLDLRTNKIIGWWQF